MAPPTTRWFILYGCSSFQNLGGACLAWWGAHDLARRVGAPQCRLDSAPASGRLLVLNIIRLYLMAYDLQWYEFWHNGDGVGLHDLASTAIPLLAVMWTVRHASRA